MNYVLTQNITQRPVSYFEEKAQNSGDGLKAISETVGRSFRIGGSSRIANRLTRSTLSQCPSPAAEFSRRAMTQREIDDIREAIRSGDLNAIQMLVRPDSDLSTKLTILTPGGDVLDYATRNGPLPVVEHIMTVLRGQGKLDLNAKNSRGQTPLHNAVLNKRRDAFDGELVKFLLIAGANPNAQDRQGNTPLHIVTNNIGLSPKKVKILLLNGANIRITNKKGLTPFNTANDTAKKLMYAFEGKYGREASGLHLKDLRQAAKAYKELESTVERLSANYTDQEWDADT